MGKGIVEKPKFDLVQEGKTTPKTRGEIDQSDRRNPYRKRKYKAKFNQDINIMVWALDKKL